MPDDFPVVDWKAIAEDIESGSVLHIRQTWTWQRTYEIDTYRDVFEPIDKALFCDNCCGFLTHHHEWEHKVTNEEVTQLVQKNVTKVQFEIQAKLGFNAGLKVKEVFEAGGKIELGGKIGGGTETTSEKKVEKKAGTEDVLKFSLEEHAPECKKIVQPFGIITHIKFEGHITVRRSYTLSPDGAVNWETRSELVDTKDLRISAHSYVGPSELEISDCNCQDCKRGCKDRPKPAGEPKKSSGEQAGPSAHEGHTEGNHGE